MCSKFDIQTLIYFPNPVEFLTLNSFVPTDILCSYKMVASELLFWGQRSLTFQEYPYIHSTFYEPGTF